MELASAGVVQQVAFIHDDDVCEFHLVAEELRDRALILGLRLPTAVFKRGRGPTGAPLRNRPADNLLRC